MAIVHAIFRPSQSLPPRLPAWQLASLCVLGRGPGGIGEGRPRSRLRLGFLRMAALSGDLAIFVLETGPDFRRVNEIESDCWILVPFVADPGSTPHLTGSMLSRKRRTPAAVSGWGYLNAHVETPTYWQLRSLCQLFEKRVRSDERISYKYYLTLSYIS